MRRLTACLAVLALSFTAGGCSKDHLSARYYLYRAGQIYYKTDNEMRRVKRVPFEERKPHYGEACQLYFKAFQLDSNVFSLDEIEHALQSCESAEMQELANAFADFYAVYQEEHPVESDYGFVGGGVEG